MDDLYDRQADLQNIIDTLDTLIEETDDRDYRQTFFEIKCEAQDDLDEIEEDIYKMEQEDDDYLRSEYNSQRL